MEKKIYKVKLIKDENDYLEFNIDNFNYRINLNSEEQNSLRKLFYQIIELTFKEEPEFILSEESKNYENKLFLEISEEYLKDLNNEIKSIIQNKPKF